MSYLDRLVPVKLWGALALVIGVAACLSTISSMSTLTPDSAIPYQIALRNLQGQIPYKDYYMPYGLVDAMLLTLFFAIAPGGSVGLMIASATLNVTTALLVWAVVRAVTVDEEAAIVGGVLTGAWFSPIFGSFYSDHFAYALNLAAFLWYIRLPSGYARAIGTALLFALAFYAKQPVGVIGLLAFLVASTLVVRHNVLLKRDIYSVIGFYILSHLSVWLLIYIFTDFHQFFDYTFLLAAKYGAETRDFARIAYHLLLPYGINPFNMISERGLGRLVFYPVVLTVYLAYYVVFGTLKSQAAINKMRARERNTMFALVFVALSTLWSAAFLGRNFAHSAFGIGAVFALTTSLWQYNRKPWKYAIAGLLALTALAHLVYYRQLLSTPDKYYSQTGLSPIRITSNAHREGVGSQSVRDAIDFLRDKPGEIALLDDDTYLIPLALERAPVNPPVWYTAGETIPLGQYQIAEWQDEFIGVLEAKRTRFVISSTTLSLDEPLEYGYRGNMLAILPKLAEYIQEQYSLVLESGTIRIYGRTVEE